MSRAPADCFQYHTGVFGNVQSMNFEKGQILSSQVRSAVRTNEKTASGHVTTVLASDCLVFRRTGSASDRSWSTAPSPSQPPSTPGIY